MHTVTFKKINDRTNRTVLITIECDDLGHALIWAESAFDNYNVVDAVIIWDPNGVPVRIIRDRDDI